MENSNESAFQKKKNQQLFIGILFDILGVATYFVPALGEMGDLAWAPIASMVYFGMYRGLTGLIGGSFVFLEEIFPFTDFMPTFTITWLWIYMINEKKSKASFLEKMNDSNKPIPIDSFQK